MILCIARIPPNANRSGGAQRAANIVNCLSEIDDVHLVVLFPSHDEAVKAQIDPRIEGKVQFVDYIGIDEWNSLKSRHPFVPWKISAVFEFLRIRSPDAPQFSKRTLRAIASRIPSRHYETVFCIRPASAWIAQTMISAGLISADRKIADLDDILSEFRRKQTVTERASKGRLWAMVQRLEVIALRNAERNMARFWDRISLCSDEDVDWFRRNYSARNVCKVPNALERPKLEAPTGRGLTLLFVGNLSFDPNVQGILRFIETVWPGLHAQIPDMRLLIVGMSPGQNLVDAASRPNIELHANVDSVEPFYREADLVICPVLFGTGTRIKILEAMAFNRAVLATDAAAEGLDLENRRQAIIVDRIEDFSDEILRLSSDKSSLSSVAEEGNRYQQSNFGPEVFKQKLLEMMSDEA